MPHWVISGTLATSPRPGFSSGPEYRVAAEVVDRWLEDVHAFGIRSVICLLAADQLWLYQHSLPGGLITRYRESGLEVAHIPTLDQQTHPFTPDQYEEAWLAFERLPRPVLVHCSAGYDRTGRIVNHILANIRIAEGAPPE